MHGTLNGADYEKWDPQTDSNIKSKYGPKSLKGKEECKKSLARKLSLKLDDRTPLLCMVTRLSPQKGIDLMHSEFRGTHGAGRRPGDFRFRRQNVMKRFLKEQNQIYSEAVSVRNRGSTKNWRIKSLQAAIYAVNAFPVRTLRPDPDVCPPLRNGSTRASGRRSGRYDQGLPIREKLTGTGFLFKSSKSERMDPYSFKKHWTLYSKKKSLAEL